jgi:hypothetical protein
MSSISPTPTITPGIAPPPGQQSNFIDPPSQASLATIVMAVYLALTTPLLIMRMYTRIYINKLVKWDDCKCIQ